MEKAVDGYFLQFEDKDSKRSADENEEEEPVSCEIDIYIPL